MPDKNMWPKNPSQMISVIVNSLLFWLAWILTLIFVARDDLFYANLSIWIPTLLQFWLSFRLQFSGAWRELFLAAYTFFIALFFETALISMNLVYYRTMVEGQFFPPAWILGLWLFFSTTMNRTLSFMNRSYFFAPLLGLMAPFSYFAGEKAGACSFPKGEVTAFIGLFIIWTFASLLLIYLNRALLHIEERLDKGASLQGAGNKGIKMVTLAPVFSEIAWLYKKLFSTDER